MKTRVLSLVLLAACILVPTLQLSAQADLESRRKALNDLFAQIWEDRLSHSPEFASTIGDNRFNDQLTD